MPNNILGNILRISRSCNTYRREALPKVELYPALHLFITTTCRSPGLTQEQLAARFCLDRTTVAHQLNKLEKHGYIERRVSLEDARCRCIYPTEKAQLLFPSIHGAYVDFTEGLLEGLSEAEQAELSRLTDILNENAVRMMNRVRREGTP